MLVTLSSQEITNFQEKIISWYKQNKRDLPWRKTSDPYKILVSEVMSQQTQLTRVVPKYNEWLKYFPTINDVATASTSDVLTQWSGLGYNRRALNLQKTARVIKDEYNGIFPQDVHILESLPGIGKYTSSAIMCFAFNQQITVIDTNIKKVILTQFLHANLASDLQITTIAKQLLPKGLAKEWNEALMDYASLELKNQKITISKQSTFKQSRRYYRGQVLKLLVKEKVLNQNALVPLFIDSPYKQSDIIMELVKDGLIKYSKNMLYLP